MKADDAHKDGDVSPITQSVSNLADDGKASTSTAKAKKTEPSFEQKPNFSRVTPAQLTFISFPSDGRYQPVRAVSAKSPLSKSSKAGAASTALVLGSEKYAGGGGILLLTDSQPEQEASYIEIQTAAVVAPQAQRQPSPVPIQPIVRSGNQPPPAGPHISLDESAPESEPPEAFEVGHSIFVLMSLYLHILHSTHLITIPRNSVTVHAYPRESYLLNHV